MTATLRNSVASCPHAPSRTLQPRAQLRTTGAASTQGSACDLGAAHPDSRSDRRDAKDADEFTVNTAPLLAPGGQISPESTARWLRISPESTPRRRGVRSGGHL